MADDKTVLLRVELDTTQLEKNAKASEAALAKLVPELKKIGEEQGKTSIAYVKAKNEIALQNKTLKDSLNAIEKTAKANKNNTGSLNEMKDRLSAATLAYNNLSKSERENAEVGGILKEEISGLSSELKENESAVGNNTRNVGNYSDAVGGLSGPLGAASNGVKGLGAQFKLLLANPIVLVITGIVAAFVALGKAFTRTEEGQNKLAKATAVFSYIFEKLFDLLVPIAEFIGDVLGKAFEDAGIAIDMVAQGIANALEYLGFEDAANGVRDYVAETERALAMVQKIADLRAGIEREERTQLVERAKREAEIAEIREKAADKENVSAEERMKLLKRAGDLNDEIFAKEEQIAKAKFIALREENKLTESNIDAKRAEAEAEAEYISVQTSRANNQRKLTAELVTAERELESDRAKAAAEAKKRHEDYLKRVQEQLKFARLIRDEEIKLIDDVLERERTALIESQERRIKDLDFTKYSEEKKAKLTRLIRANLEKDLEKYDEDARVKRNAAYEKEYGAVNDLRTKSLVIAKEIVDEDVRHTKQGEEEKTQITSDEALKRVTVALNSAQQLSNALFQIKQNQIQNELNADKEKYDEQTQLLNDQLDAGLISQADYDAKKSELDSKAAAKEKKLKEEAFKKEKAAALISAAINTAVGVTAAAPVVPLMVLTAALGAIEIATIASQPTPKFEKGGGLFGGKPHSQGGTKGYFDDGTNIEVEKDEMFFILNKNAKNRIAQLSALNTSTGGVPLMEHGGVMKFEGGGAVLNAASQSGNNAFNQQQQLNAAITALPPIFVAVEDINTGQGQRANVVNRADF